MELMAAYPGRPFRMMQLVNYVGASPKNNKERSALREGVRTVLKALINTGTVRELPRRQHGGYATYIWKVPDEPPRTAIYCARIEQGEL